MEYNGPPFDPEKIKQMAQSFIERYATKHKAEHHAMDRQNERRGDVGKVFLGRRRTGHTKMALDSDRPTCGPTNCIATLEWRCIPPACTLH